MKFDLATRIICSLSAKESMSSLITICELTSETAVLSVLKSTSGRIFTLLIPNGIDFVSVRFFESVAFI